jgi:hypothetical protein
MNNIIQQIVTEWTVKFESKACSSKIMDLDALADEISNDCREMAKRVLEAVIQELNTRISEDKQRRKSIGLSRKDKGRERSILTSLGMIHFQRDYYKDRTNGKYVYPLDHLLGIEKYERVGGSVSSRLVRYASTMSYAKSARLVAGDAVSRQSVHDAIRRSQLPAPTLPETKRKVKVLHIFADEDHVHLQKPGHQRGKKSQIVPLVVVTEGVRDVGGGRRRTIRPKYFVDREFSPEALWKAVEGYIDSTYNMDYLQTIYVHADGGRWIKGKLDNFGQTIHIMDGFHVMKYLKKLSSAFPKKNPKASIFAQIKKNDRKAADRYFQEMLDETEGDIRKNRQKTVQDVGRFIMNNWEEIRRLQTVKDHQSCTEAQVSHVLSERFSRDPMGWGKECLGELSSVRIFLMNGGEFNKNCLEKRAADAKENTAVYEEYAENVVKEFEENPPKDWSIFGSAPKIFDKASGTQTEIQKLGTPRNFLC